MRLIRLLTLLCAILNITISARHLPGVQNASADALSRNKLSVYFRLNPQASPVPTILPAELQELVFNTSLRWTSPDWMGAIEHYIDSCVAPATRSAYGTAHRRYTAFCGQFGIASPYPLTEGTLCRYVAFLGQEGLKHSTIKAYLSGIRFAQIHLSLGNPFSNGAMPRFEYVLTGIKRVEARTRAPQKPRLPITVEIMARLKDAWRGAHEHPDTIMLWAAACTGFFGFLRAGEFTTPSRSTYDPEAHLSLGDVALDSHSAPSVVRLRIKQSKTDPFRQGMDVYVGATNACSGICPVEALLAYIAIREANPGPLFIFQSGASLTRGSLVQHLQAALTQAGIPCTSYTGHSFRIGAATTAARCGISDSLIQTLGRWKSAAYKVYIRLPREQLASVSCALVRQSSSARNSAASIGPSSTADT